MIKKGITLVETVIVLSLLSIVTIVTYSFIRTNDSLYLKICSYSDYNINGRIAMEYIIDRINNSQNIELREYSNPQGNGLHIRVETKFEEPTDILLIDGERIYIKKSILNINGKQRIENILRCDTDSQQVVNGIYAFEVWDRGNGLYQVTIFLSNPDDHSDTAYPGNHILSSYAKKRYI